MIDDENPLLRIFLTRSFYYLLYLTHHFTLGFSKRSNPWRSVKVAWRVPWRGKCSLSFSAVREGPWRYREEVREEKAAWVRIFFSIRSCRERPRPTLDSTHCFHCWGLIIDRTSQPLRSWRGLVHRVCAAVCIQYLQNSAYRITTNCVVAGVSQSIEHMKGSIRKLTLIPWSSVKHSVKHLLLRLAFPGHWVELNLVVQLSALTFQLISGSLGWVLGKFG